MATGPIVIEPRARQGLTILDENLEVLLTCDATVNERHEANARITEYPRENLSPASDHIQPEQLKLSADIIVTPTSLIPGLARRGRDRDAFELLRSLQENRRVVTLVTSLRVYTNMALKSMSAPRSNGVGQALSASTSWHQIEVANTQTATIPANVIAALARSSAKGKDKTKDQVAEAQGPEPEKTFARRKFDALVRGD